MGIIIKVKEMCDYYFEEWCDQCGWFIYCLQVNFIFIELKNVKGEIGVVVVKFVYDFFYKNKVFVCYFLSYFLIVLFLCISVGIDDEMFMFDEKF